MTRLTPCPARYDGSGGCSHCRVVQAPEAGRVTHFYGDDCPGGHLLKRTSDVPGESPDTDWETFFDTSPQEGRKDDGGKLRYDLIPPECLEALAHVYTIGAEKYGADNYLKGMKWRRIVGALYRHMGAWLMGRTKDPDQGQHPLASVAWCAFTLMLYERYGLGEDDRPSLEVKDDQETAK